MPTKRITLEWVNRERLRLRMAEGVPIALHDDRGRLPPESYLVQEERGEIALMSDPVGEVTAELEDDAPPRAWQGAEE